MVVCGLNVTVLCGLGEWELESVGGGRSGDVSVEVEAIAGSVECDGCFQHNLHGAYPEPHMSLGVMFLRGVKINMLSHGEWANTYILCGCN